MSLLYSECHSRCLLQDSYFANSEVLLPLLSLEQCRVEPRSSPTWCNDFKFLMRYYSGIR